MRSTLATDLTHDAFLGGRLRLWQPCKGYRAGVDPVLLAASVHAQSGQSVLDLGCGAGAAALCLGARIEGLELVGVEKQASYAELARKNGLSVHHAVIEDLPADIRQRMFDHVLCNPPYYDRRTGHKAKDSGRETAFGEDTPLAVWLETAARRLKPKGYLHLILHAERLPMLLAAARGLGSIEILPLASRQGRPADRIILRARKEGRAPFRLHAPLVLHSGSTHESDTADYTPDVAAALRDGKSLNW